MNPIIAELKRLAPEYKPTYDDISEIKAAEDPILVAAMLEERLNDWRRDFAEAVGCEPDMIAMSDAVAAADLSLAIRGQSISLGSMQAALGRDANFNVGRTIGQEETYRRVARQLMEGEFALAGRNRPAQKEGVDYWAGQLRTRSLFDVWGDIRREV